MHDPDHPFSAEFHRLLSEAARASLSGYAPSNSGRRSPLSAATRQMHLGVFVLGTGNHSAGWRWEGATTSNASWPVMLEIAQIAERGKFDLFFIPAAVVMEPGDHPSFVCRFEPTALMGALSSVTRHIGL